MSRPLVALALLLAVCAGCDSSFPSGSAASPTPLTINRSGSGIGHSADFHLVAGDYAVAWSATDPKANGCLISLSLAGNGGPIPIVSTNITGQKTGTNFLHGVPPGTYYIDSASTCVWRAALVGGPPPTAPPSQ